MSAPKGNQFWKLRSKHGRDKLFASPDLLWGAASEYFEWCDSNPLMEVDYRGKDVTAVELPRMRAYTMEGLCLYLDVNVVYFNHFEEGLKNKEQSKEKQDFSKVITRIRDIIYTQKFTGAAAGFLNANIIARDLGLKEKSDLTTDGRPIDSHMEVAVTFTPMSRDED